MSFKCDVSEAGEYLWMQLLVVFNGKVDTRIDFVRCTAI